MGDKTPEALEDEVIAMYTAGLGAPAIREATGLAINTVYAILERNEIQKRTRGDARQERDYTEIAKAYAQEVLQEGMSVNAFVRKWGITWRTIDRVRTEYGLENPAGADDALKEERDQLVVEQYAKGMSVRDIAKRYEIVPGTVYAILSRANIPTRRDRKNAKLKEAIERGKNLRAAYEAVMASKSGGTGADGGPGDRAEGSRDDPGASDRGQRDGGSGEHHGADPDQNPTGEGGSGEGSAVTGLVG